MALRRSRPFTFRPRGLSDAVDGTNTFPGAMRQLANLIPAPHTRGIFIPRPASTSLTTFSSFTTPAQLEALLVVGSLAYGMIASARFAGKSEPFAYNLLTNTFLTISGVTSASLPATQPTAGDWTPPRMAVIGSRIVATHPGFAGGADPYFGWLDISGLNSTTITGNTTTSSTTVDNLSSNVLQAGWNVGMAFSATGIPAGTTILSIAADGLSVVISQAATATAAGVALTVTGGTPAAPQWAAGNTNGAVPLPSVPVSVAQFNGRAYYAVKNATVFSDSGNATQVTNATQVLTFQNGLDVTALAGLPLSAQQGGIIQALIAFQGDANMVQITGDPATNNLATNNLNVATGTLAPNTICSTPMGLAFVAPDGVRIIDFLARVGDPIGAFGQGVVVPFLNAINPSRMCAAFNQNVLRLSVQNGAAINQPVQEYWLDFGLKIWTGPHSFPSALIQPWASPSKSTFVLAASGINAQLWKSDPIVTSSSIYTENGAAMTFGYQTVLLPDNQAMAENAVVETAAALALPNNSTITIQALDENGNSLDQIVMSGPSVAPPIWGAVNWGSFVWGGSASILMQRQIPWTQPLVFKQMSLTITGESMSSLAIGDLFLRYEILGYLIQR